MKGVQNMHSFDKMIIEVVGATAGANCLGRV